MEHAIGPIVVGMRVACQQAARLTAKHGLWWCTGIVQVATADAVEVPDAVILDDFFIILFLYPNTCLCCKPIGQFPANGKAL